MEFSSTTEVDAPADVVFAVLIAASSCRPTALVDVCALARDVAAPCELPQIPGADANLIR
jgi:hypothetical protein